MKKRVLVSTLREIVYAIEDWDEETFARWMEKPELKFHKFLSTSSEWSHPDKWEITIKVEKKNE